MPDFVVDASAVLKTVLDEPEAKRFRRWLAEALASDADIHSSGVLPYEVAQGIWRRGVANREEAFARCIYGVRLHDTARQALRHVDPLSAYDASYLATAISLGATLVSYDQRLVGVARNAGIKVLQP
ncbi:MAG TPA: type II toxin-antitoxin system VapC family toxin [Candidatus Thermoplasmatota archaeon]|nr:type II toxin-antitoxin system VapC family toxin [Candidatus Thermoplasmatota archaeon]